MINGFEFNILYIISQIFAFTAIIFDLIAAQRRRKVELLKMDTLAAFCSSLHYAFLGAWSGLMGKLITTIRNAIATREAAHRQKTNRLLPYLFVLLYVVMGIFTFDSVFSIIPIVAPSLYTIVIYMRNVTAIRYAVVWSNALWLIYDIHAFSIVGVIAETIVIINAMIAIYRYKKKRKR